MKKFIIATLCFIVYVVLAYILYTHCPNILERVIYLFGCWYIGKLIGTLVDWLCKKET